MPLDLSKESLAFLALVGQMPDEKATKETPPPTETEAK